MCGIYNRSYVAYLTKRQSAQNQKDTPPGYGLQVRLGALVHAIGNGAASPAVLKV